MIIFALLWLALALAELTLFQTPILILLFLGFTIYYARRDHLRTTVHTQVGTDRRAVLPARQCGKTDALRDHARWSPERIHGPRTTDN